MGMNHDVTSASSATARATFSLIFYKRGRRDLCGALMSMSMSYGSREIRRECACFQGPKLSRAFPPPKPALASFNDLIQNESSMRLLQGDSRACCLATCATYVCSGPLVSDADQAEVGTDLKPFSVFRKGVHQSSTKPLGIQINGTSRRTQDAQGLWPKKKHHSTGILYSTLVLTCIVFSDLCVDLGKGKQL